MQAHEKDVLLNPEGHVAPARHLEEIGSTGPDALIHGRTDALSPAAVMHLQKAAGNASVSAAMEEPSLVKDVVHSGGGAPLDRGTRSFMESSLGADFGDVRVHTDSKATESARSVQAHAYTVGSNVVFQSDKYSPDSDSGKRMLAHELTHVVQQRSGPVDGTEAPGGIKISQPSDGFEQAAERSADRVMLGAPGLNSSTAAAPAGMQRAAEEDTDTEPKEEDKPLQGSFVQRAAADDKDLEED